MDEYTCVLCHRTVQKSVGHDCPELDKITHPVGAKAVAFASSVRSVPRSPFPAKEYRACEIPKE